jgi:sugar lactone lactonase YvrE
VKKAILAVLLIACFVGAAMAADRPAYSVARPDVVRGGQIAVHPFVNEKEIASTATKVFISDAANNVVNIYNTSGKQLAQLTGFAEPQGLATDAKGNLYVADTENSRIVIYAPPYKKITKTLSDSGQYPAGVSVFNNGAVIGVTNIISTSGGAGSVTIYKKYKAGKAISNSNFARVYFDAFDGNGNLYIDGSNSNGGVEVGEIAKATTTGNKIATLTTKNTIEFPGGVQVTTKGLIAIDDQEGAAVYSYKAPSKGSLGNPTATTPLTGSDLWTADASNEDSAEYAYPKGGSAVKTISVTGGEPIGAAVVPAEVAGK